MVNHEVDSCFQASLCQHSSYTLTSHHISGAIEVLLNGPFTSGCRNHNLAISVLNKRFYVMLSPYNSQPVPELTGRPHCPPTPLFSGYC